jgi:hypothetical protein
MGSQTHSLQEKGLSLGNVLSCMLFNTALEKAVRVAGLYIRGTTLNKSVKILAYADDILITGKYERSVTEAFTQRETTVKQMWLM